MTALRGSRPSRGAERKWVLVSFNKFISGKTSRVITAAALECDGTVLRPCEIDYYIKLLRGNKLLGVGGDTSTNIGAPLRRMYLQPPVARTVSANRSALHACLAKVVAPTYTANATDLPRVSAVQGTGFDCCADAAINVSSIAAEAATSALAFAASAASLATEAKSAEEAADNEGLLVFTFAGATWHCDGCSMGSATSGVCKCCALFFSRHRIIRRVPNDLVLANGDTHTWVAPVSRRFLVVCGASRIVCHKRRGTRPVSVR